MPTSHYIGVVHQAQALRAREMGIVAFSHGRQAAVKGLNPGDAVILYAPKTDFDGDPVQAFVAHARVTGDASYQRDFAPGMTAWVRDANYDNVTEVPVRPMLEHLSFVKNPKHWGVAFRQGKFAIPEPDYRLITDALLGTRP